MYIYIFLKALSGVRDKVRPYMLNTRNEDTNTAFYSELACFVNRFPLNMRVSMSGTLLPRRNTLFVFLWLRHRNA